VKRVNVSAAFFLSIEFQQTGFFVYLLHRAAFDAGEHLALARFLADVGEVRRGVVVGLGNWDAQLEANRQAFTLLFVQRPEFLTSRPTSTSRATSSGSRSSTGSTATSYRPRWSKPSSRWTSTPGGSAGRFVQQEKISGGT
jgi:hypothetical protein